MRVAAVERTTGCALSLARAVAVVAFVIVLVLWLRR